MYPNPYRVGFIRLVRPSEAPRSCWHEIRKCETPFLVILRLQVATQPQVLCALLRYCNESIVILGTITFVSTRRLDVAANPLQKHEASRESRILDECPKGGKCMK